MLSFLQIIKKSFQRLSNFLQTVVLALRLNWFGLLCNLNPSYRTKSSQIVNSLTLLFIFLKTQIPI